jgi:hypothetical protein
MYPVAVMMMKIDTYSANPMVGDLCEKKKDFAVGGDFVLKPGEGPFGVPREESAYCSMSYSSHLVYLTVLCNARRWVFCQSISQ